jgi:hypothetical protein
MKLARISKPLPSVQVRVTLGADLNSTLENYARYYQHIHGDSVDSKALIPEILRAFLDADREFQMWQRSGNKHGHRRDTSLPSTNGNTKAGT